MIIGLTNKTLGSLDNTIWFGFKVRALDLANNIELIIFLLKINSLRQVSKWDK
jgi:hypothetical protein